VSKNYEPTIEGHYEKCCDERHALQMQLEEYQEALEFVRKEFHEALDDLEKMKAERDETRRRICETTDMTNPNDDCYVRLTPQQIAEHYGWDCYKKPYCFRVNGVVVSKEKAVPPKFELGEDDE
jgi:hypothetical protein